MGDINKTPVPPMMVKHREVDIFPTSEQRVWLQGQLASVKFLHSEHLLGKPLTYCLEALADKKLPAIDGAVLRGCFDLRNSKREWCDAFRLEHTKLVLKKLRPDITPDDDPELFPMQQEYLVLSRPTPLDEWLTGHIEDGEWVADPEFKKLNPVAGTLVFYRSPAKIWKMCVPDPTSIF